MTGPDKRGGSRVRDDGGRATRSWKTRTQPTRSRQEDPALCIAGTPVSDFWLPELSEESVFLSATEFVVTCPSSRRDWRVRRF